ncbi:MAG: electron transport complex subunit RsxC [Desulfobacterales bacterium]
MGLAQKEVIGRRTFAHGVHPPEHKELAAEAPIEVLKRPGRVLLPLIQHIGAPCEPLVKAKEEVVFGQMVAKGKGFVSASIHASISGVVQKTTATTLPNGRHVQAIPIKATEGDNEGNSVFEDLCTGEWPVDQVEAYRPQQILEAIHNAGIVGMGGAAFPTHVKFAPNEKNAIDAVLVNGCECEPYLTCDYRLMLEAPHPIVTGALLAARATGAKKIFIGIEDNKPSAVSVLQQAARGTGITIAVLKTKYPQGSEKQLIKAVLNREVPVGLLPLNVGVVVMNVATATAVSRAVFRNMPLTHRVVCVTGGGIRTPKNIFAPLGVSYRELIDFCGGLRENAARVISGGPMMGFAFSNLDTPVTKGTSGVTVLTENDVRKESETACIRCGRCVDVCPMNLVPTRCALAARNKDISLAWKYHITACFECGSCAYVCPANIPLVQLIRMGKTMAAARR